jgi:hypothetical protein
VQATFDKAALVQRCQQRPWVQAIMRQAYRSDGPDGTCKCRTRSGKKAWRAPWPSSAG